MRAMFWTMVVVATACSSGQADVKDDSAAGASDGADGGTDAGADGTDGADSGADGADSGADGADGGTDPYACSSGTSWTGGDRESPEMHPGVACIDCHEARGERPITVGGTVYPQAHEPDDCNGMSGLTVELTDARGEVFTMNTNRAGNFMLDGRSGTPTWPAHAVVRSATGERAMGGEINSGDCNDCHTVEGASGAPGRIQAP